MALPAINLRETPMEERVARLEANVEHIRSDIGDMKTDIGRLNDKFDRMNDKVDGVKDSVAALELKVEKSFSSLAVGRALDRVWFLLMSAALLGIMARAFGWI